jgi:site-specific recombinase XerD
MRGTFCTRLVESGMAIEQVAKLSGHSELGTLYGHYLRTTSETIRRAADLLNQMHGHDAHVDEAQADGPDYVN